MDGIISGIFIHVTVAWCDNTTGYCVVRGLYTLLATVWVWIHRVGPLIARFMGQTWGPSGTDRTQVGPMLAPWTLLSRLRVCYQPRFESQLGRYNIYIYMDTFMYVCVYPCVYVQCMCICIDNLSPFDSKITCLCQSIKINNKHVCMHVACTCVCMYAYTYVCRSVGS